MDIHTDWEVDELARGRKIGGSSSVVLNKRDHVRGADTALEQNTRGSERTGRQDDTAIGCQRYHAVRSKGSVVGLDASDSGAVAHDV